MLRRMKAVMTPRMMLLLAAILFVCTLFFGENGIQTEGLEERLERVLSSVEGAGRVRVVVSTRPSGTVQPSGLLDTRQEKEGEIPYGAAIVAQGGNDPIVRMQLMEAACAVLGLPPASVSVSAGR